MATKGIVKVKDGRLVGAAAKNNTGCLGQWNIEGMVRTDVGAFADGYYKAECSRATGAVWVSSTRMDIKKEIARLEALMAKGCNYFHSDSPGISGEQEKERLVQAMQRANRSITRTYLLKLGQLAGCDCDVVIYPGCPVHSQRRRQG